MTALTAFPLSAEMLDRLPHLITGDADEQLAVALDISNRVFSGEYVSLPAMITAREVIDTHTHAKATVALLGRYIEARRDEIRYAERPPYSQGVGTIRLLLASVAGTVFAGWLALVLMLGVA